MRIPLFLGSLLVASFPSSAQSQRAELFFNAGTIIGKPGIHSEMIYRRPVPPATSAGILFNRGALQYGARLEAALNRDNMYQIAPALTANYRVLNKHSYWYAGGCLGYQYSRDHDRWFEEITVRSNHGIMLGAQSGYVLALNGRLALNAEIAYRLQSCRWDYGEVTIPEGMTFCPAYNPGPATSFYNTVPLTLGIRYSL